MYVVHRETEQVPLRWLVMKTHMVAAPDRSRLRGELKILLIDHNRAWLSYFICRVESTSGDRDHCLGKLTRLRVAKIVTSQSPGMLRVGDVPDGSLNGSGRGNIFRRCLLAKTTDRQHKNDKRKYFT